MPRAPRNAPGGLIYHVLNRGVARRTLFHKNEDYAAFERVLAEVHREIPCRILAHCLMPNHWHFVLWPREDGELSSFVGRLTHTHTQRYHAHYHTTGTGHLYQGRFKNFPVSSDIHLLLVLRYVERNALRANLVTRAQDWTWNTLWRREQQRGTAMLSEWPIERPADWTQFVNEPQTNDELEAIRQSVRRGSPFGDDEWREEIARKLGIESTRRQPGRPKQTLAASAKG